MVIIVISKLRRNGDAPAITAAALLPADYYFTANDAGSHTFTNGVTLMKVGNQSITAIIIGAPGINGSANVTVSATTIAMQFKVSAPSRSFRPTTP
ncbi:hypothetical protein SBA1_1040035 [Candidatus Sulfotelmatobacter kueseliae]|uniref:Uncharacterized protein n=1 Tax=Candidatus Sulfotelmatobacter kueseliae TaxID=2042962 RepID=A0A2U3JY75_9BACT|nr:hypothetical protein SBA1_1040035 [Candidatus Sulfotelmatobacter kueseliae]